ncbi:MAG: DUF1844 domain-containing protein [Thermodesulfobacteriota bacterium]
MTEGNGFTMANKKDTLPKIDFSSFILSLYSSGLVQLGQVEDPSSAKKSVNLDLAKHTINIIAMLEEKTRGNLNEDEKNLLKTLLSELRVTFVKAKT